MTKQKDTNIFIFYRYCVKSYTKYTPELINYICDRSVHLDLNNYTFTYQSENS